MTTWLENPESFPFISIVIPTYNRKGKLTRLITSIHNSTYPADKLEIIVVDDASTDNTSQHIKSHYPITRIIRNNVERLVSACRNCGLQNANGKYVFFIDDDNVIDKYCLECLVKFLEENDDVGVVGPIMYYYDEPTKVWCAGIKRNYVTSITTYVGRDTVDCGQFREPILSEDFPNAFMARKQSDVCFDERNFPIHFEESDFIQKIRQQGYKVYTIPQAKVWHDLRRDINGFTGFETNWRTYYTARNRLLFLRKYSASWQYILFITLFLPLLSINYLLKIFIYKNDRIKIAKSYLRGIVDGIAGRGGNINDL